MCNKNILQTTRVSFSKTISQRSSLLSACSFLFWVAVDIFTPRSRLFCRRQQISRRDTEIPLKAALQNPHVMGFGDPQKISWNELMTTLDLSLKPSCFKDDSPAKVEKTCILAFFFRGAGGEITTTVMSKETDVSKRRGLMIHWVYHLRWKLGWETRDLGGWKYWLWKKQLNDYWPIIDYHLNKPIRMMIISSHNDIQVPKPFCASFGWFGCIFPVPFGSFNWIVVGGIGADSFQTSSVCCV